MDPFVAPPPALRVEALSVRLGATLAVEGASFELGPG